jgi:pimeloyl-ACP methyl ester carboxylesterase
MTHAAHGEAAVLLHGLGRSHRSMGRLAHALRAAGYAVENVGYPSTQQPLEKLVHGWVRPAVDRLSAHGATRIHFVTHSMGGILVREYLRKARPPNLGRVVMLAPPNAGSEIVDRFGGFRLFAWVLGPAALQLGTSAEHGPQRFGPADFPLGIITGNRSLNPLLDHVFADANDGKVTVSSARLDGMSDFRVLPLGHTFIMQRRAVIDEALHFLAHGRFRKPPSR